MPRQCTPPIERFWAKVDKSGDCWLWTASLNQRTHYGQFGLGRRGPGHMADAHRYSWVLHYGPIPDGLWVLHRCDNRHCVRPDHLFLGTAADNTHDMMAKGRSSVMPAGRRGLNPDAVRDIRRRRAAHVPVRVLAEEYGVSEASVSLAANRLSWRHVA